jgi:pyruvate, orthophosphate dikinase
MRSECLIEVEESGQAWGRLASRNPENGSGRISAEVHLAPWGVADGAPLPYYSFQKAFPQAERRLREQIAKLEEDCRDALQADFVFTNQTIHLTNIRSLVCAPEGTVKVAVSFVKAGLLTKEEALSRVQPEDIRRMLLPRFQPTQVRQAIRQKRLLATGTGIFGGVVSGIVARDTESVFGLSGSDQPIILVCPRLSQSEREALRLISGLVIAEGPTLSAFQYELPCVLSETAHDSLKAGEIVSLDAGTGQIFGQTLEQIPGELNSEALTLLQWADEVREMEVRANVGTPEDVKMALAFGADGVGLCRIESLFLRPVRLPLFQVAVREICVEERGSSSSQDRLTQEIEDDIHGLLEAGSALGQGPFTIRLLDAPVAQMLGYWKESKELSSDYFQPPLSAWLGELNPMQGLRCGRLSLMYPRLMDLQIRALLGAWHRVRAEGTELRLQVMMPGVTDAGELRFLRNRMKMVADELGLESAPVGSMLELPRACLMADRLAEQADFLSFGTGDLTESTCGMSRYDSQLSFLPEYLKQKVFPRDPFQSIDQAGVGALMKIAAQAVNDKFPTVELGTCGAQAMDSESLEFCCRIGLRYVSVPAHHVPVARLAAARAELS